MSTNAIRAPAWVIASVVAIKVCETVTTVSPCFTPAAIKAKRTASVPLASPTQYRVSQNLANSRSNSSTIGPPTKPAVRRTFWHTARSSASSSTCGVTRSRKGIFSLLDMFWSSIDAVMSCKNVLFFNIPQYARGIAGHNSVSRHILGHHAARSHQGVFADSDLGQNCGAGTNRCALFHQSLLNLPVLLGLQLAVRSGGAGIGIVDKGNIMADEHFVFYHHTFTDKRVARNLTVFADLGVFLNLDESSYFGAVANLAAIQVDKFRKAHIFSEVY